MKNEYLRRIRFHARRQNITCHSEKKRQREAVAKVNIPNVKYPNQHIDIKIPHGSKGYDKVSDNVKIMFNLDVGLTNKTRSIVKNSSFNDLKIAIRTSLLH